MEDAFYLRCVPLVTSSQGMQDDTEAKSAKWLCGFVAINVCGLGVNFVFNSVSSLHQFKASRLSLHSSTGHHRCKALSMRSRGQFVLSSFCGFVYFVDRSRSFVLSSFCGFVIDHNEIKILFSSWLSVFEHHFLIAGLKHLPRKKEISLKICFLQPLLLQGTTTGNL